MANEDLKIYDTAVDLLDCALTGIIDAGLPIPCRVCVVPGEIVWDECGDGGQLEISVSSVFYSTTFPTDTSTDTTNPGVCGPGIAVAALTLSLMRCAPMPKGPVLKAPTCEALSETALLISRDSFALRTSLLCCLKELKNTNMILEYSMGAATVDGPQGGCVGNSISMFVGFANA